jgi:hypothetical protein
MTAAVSSRRMSSDATVNQAALHCAIILAAL